ncbi:RNA-directed DNA polymerase from mobile element jockey-like [Brachionus plicatilis]|uniref:RNA-directed DNA polymerase from mobile element jockey-like n=1 Tax=Brachionus plicatilis TaxID=10195 RepID=A0A3M7PQ86_BRAPC|nr:RNA-directed DNA polymerase from mobile element jockey-like [Brachionus plicatilis]
MFNLQIFSIRYPLTFVKNKFEKYADDTKILSIVKDVKDSFLLQQDKDHISSWVLTWSLDLNIQKCLLMHIDPKNPNYDYTIFNKNGTIKLT